MNDSKIPNNFSFEHNNKKRITFLLATKNRPEFLEKALKNHRKVITRDDQLIVIEGDPESKSRKVVKRFSDIVDIFICDEDRSEGEALNKGILLSRGKYIKLLTDDDIFYKDAIDKAIVVTDEHPEIDVLLCGGVKQRGKNLSNAYVPPGADYGSAVSDIFKYGGCGLGMVIRRKSLPRIGFFNPRAVSLDNDFLAQAINSGANVKFCRIKMYHHFIEDHSYTIARADKMKNDLKRIKRQYGVDDRDLVLSARVKFSQVVFPKLPRSFQKFYLNMFKKKQKKLAKIKPVWDGGFS